MSYLFFQSFSNSVQEQLLQAQQQVTQNASIMQNTSGLNLALGANNSNSNNNQDSNLSAASGSSVNSDKETEVISYLQKKNFLIVCCIVLSVFKFILSLHDFFLFLAFKSECILCIEVFMKTDISKCTLYNF